MRSIIIICMLSSAAWADVSGTYTGTWGAAELHQDGAHVTGTYAYDNGRIDGTLVDDTLSFTWTENGGAGRGVFVVGADGVLRGTWGIDDDHSGGEWELHHATRSDWSVGLRMPFDIGGGGGMMQWGVIGLGLDVGTRVGEHGYLGGSLDGEMYLTASDATSGAFGRVRVGVEARYQFHDGTAYVSYDEGPQQPVARHDWIGVRDGAEWIRGKLGHFAEVVYGWDAQLGETTTLGMYLGAGVAIDRGDALGGSGTATSAYMTIGMRLGLL
jgi:hypothetical protein